MLDRYIHSTLISSLEHRNAPWYVRNTGLHRDLKMEMVTAEIGRFARKHEEGRLRGYNVEAIQLLDNRELQHRRKGTLQDHPL